MKFQKRHLLAVLLFGAVGINIPVFAAIPWTSTGTNIWSDGAVGIGTSSTPSKLSINGDLLIQPATIPMGLMTELGSTATPIFNMSMNFRGPNIAYGTKGGGFRIDSRSTDPLFQWISRKSGAGNPDNVIMSLNEGGQLNIQNGVIQRGGAPITGTQDLGLYSQVQGNYVRIVSKQGQIRFYNDGDVGGATSVAIIGQDMIVGGVVKAHELQVKSNPWADYVFEDDYKLKPLNEVESYIKENKHLSEIPAAKEVQEKGISIGDMQAKQMAKIEELTLYVIDLQKQIDELKVSK